MISNSRFGKLSVPCLVLLTAILSGCQGIQNSGGGGGGGGTTGTGTPAAAISPATLAFGNEQVGQPSTANTVTITNSGTASLSITGITISGQNSTEFVEGNTSTCGSTLAAGANCVISLTFSPAAPGTRTASLTIADNATGSPQTVSITGNGVNLQSSINHIIFMAQENRSFDHYFGQLPAYWAANGYPSQPLEVMQPGQSIPGYNGGAAVSAYHIATECTDNLSPFWNESHISFNLNNPTEPPAANDGFVQAAGNFSHSNSLQDDLNGMRAMGYYDQTDLPYYYFMASNFGISDKFFSPLLDRTQLNRLYLFAATSWGYVYPPGTNSNDATALPVPTIFDELDTANVSWKIYATDTNCAPNNSPCTYLTQFAKYNTGNLPANVVSADQFITDAQNGTLPSVSYVEPGYNSARDEHPENNVQNGAYYVSTLINTLMASPSWKDSVFILTYDEGGGLYDHFSPQPAVPPDSRTPVDLETGDICYGITDPSTNCLFNYTGYRVPVLVISPFAKKNYVSHTVADFTAILKLIETRFAVPALTKRDAAQPDMTEFFDFAAIPWATPPTGVPAQPWSGDGTGDGGACDYTLETQSK